MKSKPKPVAKPVAKAAKKAAAPAVKKSAPAAKKTAAKPASKAAALPAAGAAKSTAAEKRAKADIRAQSTQPVPQKPLGEPFHTKEDPNARGAHTTAGREEIREITHRVMGSRQSQRPAERHDQPRKKR